MKVVALCLLIVRGASFDLTTTDVSDLLDGVQYHHKTLRSYLQENIHLPLDSIIPPQPQDQMYMPEDECAECRMRGARWVTAHAIQELMEKCKAAREHHCGRMVRVCMMMRLHPNVTLGMVIEHVRPFALSDAYCAGKGVCTNRTSLDEIVSGSEAHGLVLKHFDQVDWDEVIERAVEPEEEEELEENQEENEQEELAEMEMQVCEARQEDAMEAKPHNHDHGCFKKVMKKVMFKAVMRVKMMCVKYPDNQRIQRMCAFAKEHRDIAFGMLLAKVEPWKFAMGACRKHHGHHGHHGGEQQATRWKKAMMLAKYVVQEASKMIAV